MATDFDKGYINGFYSALLGVEFGAKLPGATLKTMLEDVQDTLEEIRNDPEDSKHINGIADKLVELVDSGVKSGNGEAVFEMLEAVFGGKK